LDSRTTPLECGRSFRVKLDKPIPFIGREALLKQREIGAMRLYVHLALEDHEYLTDPWPWGGEPILRDGVHVGVTTTTGYGYTLKKLVCLGFIRHFNEAGEMIPVDYDYVLSGTYEVDIAGIRYPASVSLRSPYLATGSKQTSGYQATR